MMSLPLETSEKLEQNRRTGTGLVGRLMDFSDTHDRVGLREEISNLHSSTPRDFTGFDGISQSANRKSGAKLMHRIRREIASELVTGANIIHDENIATVRNEKWARTLARVGFLSSVRFERYLQRVNLL